MTAIFALLTSEVDYDERKLRQVYGGLWQIEQSFRIMKTDLYARPVFVRKNEHIRAHFLICFVALLLIRIIQHRMGEKALSVERIERALSAATCQILKGGIIHLDDVGGAIASKRCETKKARWWRRWHIQTKTRSLWTTRQYRVRWHEFLQYLSEAGGV